MEQGIEEGEWASERELGFNSEMNKMLPFGVFSQVLKQTELGVRHDFCFS